MKFRLVCREWLKLVVLNLVFRLFCMVIVCMFCILSCVLWLMMVFGLKVVSDVVMLLCCRVVGVKCIVLVCWLCV